MKEIVNEILAHRGTMKLINDTELTDSGSHYVGDYLGWEIWVFVEGYYAMHPKNRTKYIFLKKDEKEYPISWSIKLGERFDDDDVKSFCNLSLAEVEK